MLKLLIAGLIELYGIEKINDAISENLYDRIKYDYEGRITHVNNKLYDELSEAYDNINLRFFKLKDIDRDD